MVLVSQVYSVLSYKGEAYTITARTQREEHCEEATVLAEKMISCTVISNYPLLEAIVYVNVWHKSTIAFQQMQEI